MLINRNLKLFLSLLFTLTLITVVNSVAKVTKFNVDNFSQFYDIVRAHKDSNPQSSFLCCADLDDTTLKYTDFTGSEAWFSAGFQCLAKGGIKDPLPILYLAAITAHQMNISSVQLTEKDVAITYQNMQSKLNIPVIGLTSRTFILSDITKAQLARLNIKFSSLCRDAVVLNSDPQWKAMYKPNDGVIYCSGKNKGEILIEFLRKFKYPNFGTIIVIDNDQRHLNKIEDVISAQQMPVDLILVKYKDAEGYNQTQLESLTTYINFVLSLLQPH